MGRRVDRECIPSSQKLKTCCGWGCWGWRMSAFSCLSYEGLPTFKIGVVKGRHRDECC